MSDSSDAAGRVVAADDVEPDEHDHGCRTFRQHRLGHATGGEMLGTSLYELAPGNRTWPAHYHTGNEEAVYVLDGRLRLWLGSGDGRTEHALAPGDYVALPTGPAHAHEVEAAGDGTARFLVVSTMDEPDVTILTEAGKAHIIAGDPPGEYEGRYLSTTLDLGAMVPYWDEADAGGDGSESESDGGSADGDSTATDDEAARGTGDDPATDDSAPASPVSAGDLDWTAYDHGDRRFRRKQLGAAAGGEALGASLYAVPPGGRTWPAHYHAGNEEAMYVLDGSGTATLGPERTERALEPGDYVALPTGEAGYHEIEGGAETLRYLMLSTMEEPDVTVYPDDGKVGVFAGAPPGGDREQRTLSRYLDIDAEVEYWPE